MCWWRLPTDLPSTTPFLELLPSFVAVGPGAAKPKLDRKQEDSLKRAMLDLYRDLTLLDNFTIVNYTAVIKVPSLFRLYFFVLALFLPFSRLFFSFGNRSCRHQEKEKEKERWRGRGESEKGCVSCLCCT